MNSIKKVSLIFIGIILSLFLLEICLQVTSLVIINISNYKNNKEFKNKLNSKDSITILCAGESTTYEQWPIQLEEYLKKNSTKKFNIITSALPSINIKNLLNRTFNMTEQYHPDIVISMMGVNDSSFEKSKDNKIYAKKYNIKILNLIYLIIKHLRHNLYAEQMFGDNAQVYYLELVNKYKNNNDEPKEFLNILKKYPNNIEALSNLIYLYGFYRNDFKSMSKYIDFYLNLNSDEINVKIFILAISIYSRLSPYTNNYTTRLNNLLEYLFKNKLKTTDQVINNILQISFNYKLVKLDELNNIYNLLIKYNINSYIVLEIYDYLLKNNIIVKKPNYDITFLKEPNFNTDLIKNSHIELATFLIKHKIKYICMGYPTISIDIFKNMFNNTNLKNEIIFVSNENNFKSYLKNNDYETIFIDSFAKTFGHCKKLGNSMIAENVGKVILDITN